MKRVVVINYKNIDEGCLNTWLERNYPDGSFSSIDFVDEVSPIEDFRLYDVVVFSGFLKLYKKDFWYSKIFVNFDDSVETRKTLLFLRKNNARIIRGPCHGKG